MTTSVCSSSSTCALHTVVKPTNPSTHSSPSEPQGTSEQSDSEYATLRGRPQLTIPVTEPGSLQPATYSLPERSSTDLTVSQNSYFSQGQVPEFPVSSCLEQAPTDTMSH